MKSKWSRRSFISTLGAISGGLLAPGELLSKTVKAGDGAATPIYDRDIAVHGHPIVRITSGLGSTGNIYEELGVTPLVNINGTLTVIGGSVMKPEVMEVMRQGNMHCVSIDDLEAAAGRFITKLCKSPAGYNGLVTCGAAAAILVAYAGMMTEDWENRIRACPDVTGFPKTEVIIQKAHRYPFDHQIRQTGATLVEVETKQEMINAINPKTLCIHFLHINADRGQVSGAETIEIAKAHGLYTFNDSAADVPPVERLWTAPAEGWDFVTWSGGKDIQGPQATGLLIGKEELIRYALLNMNPQEDRIGRPCKVGKESMVAFLKALEIFVNQDEAETVAMYDRRAATITKAIERFGVTALPRQYNPNGLGNVTPHYSWQIPNTMNLTGNEVREQLAATRPLAIGATGAGAGGVRGRWPEGHPGFVDEGVLVWEDEESRLVAQTPPKAGQPRGGNRRRPQDPKVFGFAMWQLKPGEDKLIADRLVQIFSNAKKA